MGHLDVLRGPVLMLQLCSHPVSVDGGSRSPKAKHTPCSELLSLPLPTSPLLSPPSLLSPPCLLSPAPFVFLLLQTSSSTVALSSPGLLPSSAPSSHHILSSRSPPPPPGPSVFLPSATKPSPGGHGHIPEVLCIEDNGQGLLPSVAPSWLDLPGLRVTAGLGITPDTPNSRFPSAEDSLGPFGTESQVRVWRDPPNLTSELSRVLPGAGCTGPQEPRDPHGLSANPVYPEEAVAATWERPGALAAFGPETTCGATPSFQELAEPAVVAVDRQAIFPDTWSLTKECGQPKERARPEPAGPENSCPVSPDEEQLGGETPTRGSLVRPTQRPETPRRPEGTTEAVAEAKREQPELPHATVMDTPSATERISTSGQAGASSHSCWAWPPAGLSVGHSWLTACSLPLRACLLGQQLPRACAPDDQHSAVSPWGQRSSMVREFLSDNSPLACLRLFPLEELPLPS